MLVWCTYDYTDFMLSLFQKMDIDVEKIKDRLRNALALMYHVDFSFASEVNLYKYNTEVVSL